MAVIALTSAKGSPGVTTTALALAGVWSEMAAERRVLLVDADMAGGDVAAGYLQGSVPSTGGLLGLTADRDRDRPDAVWDHTLALDDDASRMLLTGVTDPAQARSLIGLWPSLASTLAELAATDPPVDVLVDLGRHGGVHDATPLRERADLVLLVLRSSLVSTAAGRYAARRLVEERGGREPLALGCLLVGEGQPYSATEIGEAVGLPVVASLGWDPASAPVLSHGAMPSWRFSRSSLMRSARSAAEIIRTTGRPRSELLTLPPQPSTVPTPESLGRAHA